MLTRYMKIQDYVEESVTKLCQDRVKLGQLSPGSSVSDNQKKSIHSCIEVLKGIETATAELGAEKVPRMHMKDVFVADVLAQCTTTLALNETGNVAHVLASIILKNLSIRLQQLHSSCKKDFILGQTAAFQRLQFVSMTHNAHLPYSIITEEAILQVTDIVRRPLPDFVGLESHMSSERCTESPRKETGKGMLKLVQAAVGRPVLATRADWISNLRNDIRVYKLHASSTENVNVLA